jgi:outer membrane protein OmpA-like peptidoglycan-associated protein
LSSRLETQIRALARAIKSREYVKAILYGYATEGGSSSFDFTLSARRASVVATYLRQSLVAIHDGSVKINAVGEGAIVGSTTAMFRRVEVFVK